jgi:hypothetical protein
MKLRQLGFFRELHHGKPEGPSLVESVQQKADYDTAAIVSYLRSASIWYNHLGIVHDVLNSSHPRIGAAHIHTDGIWIWPEDLAYYVEHYNVALPSDFLDHVKLRMYRPPKEHEINFAELEF